MGILKDLIFGDEIDRMKREINFLKDRVKELEYKEKYQNDYIEEKMKYIEDNFADQIAEKCYVRSVDEGSLLYLLNKIKKHKKVDKK